VNGSVRVAAVGDLHCKRTSPGAFQTLFSRVAENADVLALCGDLTDRGLPEEAQILAGAHVTVLDGTAVEISGIGFVGTKGFAGGFGDRALQAWGEGATKIFVREAVDEALKLESALARLRTPGRVVLLHYAPVLDTVDGEPREIYPFLGSSRLEEPLNRYAASVVFHGHAHRGQPEGKTTGGVPVYNVALPLLQQLYPDRSPFRVVEIPAQQAEPAPPPVTVNRNSTPAQ